MLKDQAHGERKGGLNSPLKSSENKERKLKFLLKFFGNKESKCQLQSSLVQGWFLVGLSEGKRKVLVLF